MVDLLTVGTYLVFAGILILVAALVVESRKDSAGLKAKGGAVLLIGPIPIIFGSDAKWASVAIVLALVLLIVTIIIAS
ncbi:MAG: DUF131 domain-containing protein [Thaumarchaeota archaeon]|nr:DUF131 domain-containing protein [Nitrososphaerota archaeon]